MDEVVANPRDADQLLLLVVGDGVFASQPLAGTGTATIGRSQSLLADNLIASDRKRSGHHDLAIDDDSVSPRHATLHLADPIRIIDHGSTHGTWIRDRRISSETPTEIRLNDPIRVGSVTLIVQRRTQKPRTRALRTHDYFETRLEEECSRALRRDAKFAVLHVMLEDTQIEIFDQLSECVRDTDVVASYGSGELEILLIDAAPEHLGRIMRRIEAALAPQVAVRIGSSSYPHDGRDPSALAARARARAAGQDTDPANESEIVVADERMTELHRLVARVAAADISVLLQGETGVGKEVFAERIHSQSARAAKPFLRLNCAALTETLLESELFGYERGAFTGATQAKPGLLEVAQGGVLFLDEIGEIPASTQAKLLRVLDERKLIRVGGVTPRPIDVRIVSATNRDLEAEVVAGRFRLDLLYRLNAMSIIIPPLRERVDELQPLALRFLRLVASKMGRAVPHLSKSAVAMLRGYSWPGNVRELRNMMERATVLCRNNTIEVTDLPSEKMRATTFANAVIRPTQSTMSSGRAPIAAENAHSRDLDRETSERQRILDALESSAGNQTVAAKLLGISRRALINKLEKFGLPRPRKTIAPRTDDVDTYRCN